MQSFLALVSGVLLFNGAAWATLPDAVEVFDGDTSAPALTLWSDDTRYHFKTKDRELVLYPREVGFYEVGLEELLKSLEAIEKRMPELQKVYEAKVAKWTKTKADRAGVEDAARLTREEIARETKSVRLARLQELLKSQEERIAHLAAAINAADAEVRTVREEELALPNIDALTNKFKDTLAKSPRRVFPSDSEHVYFTSLVKQLQSHYKGATYDPKLDVDTLGLYLNTRSWTYYETIGTALATGSSFEPDRGAQRKFWSRPNVRSIGLYRGHAVPTNEPRNFVTEDLARSRPSDRVRAYKFEYENLTTGGDRLPRSFRVK